LTSFPACSVDSSLSSGVSRVAFSWTISSRPHSTSESILSWNISAWRTCGLLYYLSSRYCCTHNIDSAIAVWYNDARGSPWGGLVAIKASNMCVLPCILPLAFSGLYALSYLSI
jgi:hypothetical protein